MISKNEYPKLHFLCIWVTVNILIMLKLLQLSCSNLSLATWIYDIYDIYPALKFWIINFAEYLYQNGEIGHTTTRKLIDRYEAFIFSINFLFSHAWWKLFSKQSDSSKFSNKFVGCCPWKLEICYFIFKHPFFLF